MEDFSGRKPESGTNDQVQISAKELKRLLEAAERYDDAVICPVCGHANKKNDGICKMCSNYLF